MAYPTGTPVEESVLDNVRDTLAAIATPSYFHTVKTCVRQTNQNPYEVFAVRPLPGLIVGVPQDVSSDTVNGIIAETMQIAVMLVIQNRETYATELVKLVSDVKVAMLADVTRGGVAQDTAVVGHQLFEPDDVGGLAFASVDLQIRFRHLYGDPNTAI